MNTDDALLKTAYYLSQAQAYLRRVRAAMEQVEAAGMYPAASTERWKDDRYLYLYFPDGANGLKLDAKNRLYIGADRSRIEEARRLARNHDQHHALDRQASELGRWIASLERDIESLAARATRWPRLHPGTERVLGLENAGSSGAASPHGLGADLLASERV